MSNNLRLLPILILAIMLSSSVSARGQQNGGVPAVPGATIRDRNRQMDEYDRELERLRNGGNVPSERRRNLFPQINEDFQRIQVIHNELVRMIHTGLDYDRLMELTGELRKKSNRLRTNLALPDADETSETHNDVSTINDGHIKASLVKLHDSIVSFIGNPIFKNLALLDAKVITRASGDLRDIIHTSEDIKKSAETLSKMAKK